MPCDSLEGWGGGAQEEGDAVSPVANSRPWRVNTITIL